MGDAKPAGWLARVATMGAQPFLRDFYVYELDKQRALMLRTGRTAGGAEEPRLPLQADWIGGRAAVAMAAERSS
jgi:hypothetical protein